MQKKEARHLGLWQKDLRETVNNFYRYFLGLDYKVSIPESMLTLKLNNINELNLDMLIALRHNVENYEDMKFDIHEIHTGKWKNANFQDFIYDFSTMSAVVYKMEELVGDIDENETEANKFYKIYARITHAITYDDIGLKFGNEHEQKQIRNLYGGLVDGKCVCVGYSLILHEALKKVGVKSELIMGLLPYKNVGHAWNQVMIDGQWYNVDATNDAFVIQQKHRGRQEIKDGRYEDMPPEDYEYMLQNDEDFNKRRFGNFFAHREFVKKGTYHKCNKKFKYSKIRTSIQNAREEAKDEK